jgi:hypothetical protein
MYIYVSLFQTLEDVFESVSKPKSQAHSLCWHQVQLCHFRVVVEVESFGESTHRNEVRMSAESRKYLTTLYVHVGIERMTAICLSSVSFVQTTLANRRGTCM